jgi:hypothetical protein
MEGLVQEKFDKDQELVRYAHELALLAREEEGRQKRRQTELAKRSTKELRAMAEELNPDDDGQ